MEKEIKDLQKIIEEVEFLISEKLDIDLPNMNIVGCITEDEQKNLNCFENLSKELTVLQGSLIKYSQSLQAKETMKKTVI